MHAPVHINTHIYMYTILDKETNFGGILVILPPKRLNVI